MEQPSNVGELGDQKNKHHSTEINIVITFIRREDFKKNFYSPKSGSKTCTYKQTSRKTNNNNNNNNNNNK